MATRRSLFGVFGGAAAALLGVGVSQLEADPGFTRLKVTVCEHEPVMQHFAMLELRPDAEKSDVWNVHVCRKCNAVYSEHEQKGPEPSIVWDGNNLAYGGE